MEECETLLQGNKDGFSSMPEKLMERVMAHGRANSLRLLHWLVQLVYHQDPTDPNKEMLKLITERWTSLSS